MNIFLRLPLALGAILLAAGAWAADGRPIDERRPLKADARVSVSNVAGVIDVEAWDRNELHLTGELAPEVESLEIRGTEAALRIEVKLPRDSKRAGDTRLTLKVPAGISLEAEGVSSDVRVKGLRGAVEAESVSGDIRLDVASARVKAESVSGDVTLQAPATDSRVASVSGDVIVRGVRGELSAESVSGDLRVHAGELRRLDLETVSGDLDITAELARGAEAKLETLSGNVTLSLPKAPDGELEMQTFSGDLSSDWSPGPSRGAKQYEHAGPGSGRVRLHSFSGNVELRKHKP